jgi:hypothetical protein
VTRNIRNFLKKAFPDLPTGDDQVPPEDLQNKYDIAYQQCMCAKGNQVPGSGPSPGTPPPGEGDSGFGPPSETPSASGETANSDAIDPSKINFNDSEKEAVSLETKAPTAGGNHGDIMEAQRLLDQKGYDVGTPDGKMGPKTERAIRSFQHDKQLKETGTLTQATMDKLRQP